MIARIVAGLKGRMSASVEIACGGAAARIALRGAELKSWRVGGKELVWRGDDKFWPESDDPFSVVGWTRDEIVVAGKRYPLGLHGFARSEDFLLQIKDQKTAPFCGCAPISAPTRSILSISTSM